MRLTDAAELLVAHAERILSLVEQAQADLEAHRGSVIGRLSVAAFPTAVRGLIPDALGRLRADHPDLHVQVREDDPMRSMPLVVRGDLDMAVVQDWNNEPLPLPEGLCKGVICDDPADVALPAAHPLAGRAEIALEELSGDPWISASPDSICCDWLLRMLRAVDSEPNIMHMAHEFATQLALVDAGLGNAVLPRLGRCDVPAGVRVVPLKEPLYRRVYAVWREEAARRPAIRAMVDALRKAVPAALPDTSFPSTGAFPDPAAPVGVSYPVPV